MDAFLIGLLVVFGVAAFVVWSIVSDASVLASVGGPWMLLLYLVVPVCVAIFTWHEDVRRWLADRRY